MIYSLEGTPGTGKTLFLVQKIIPDFLNVRTPTGEIAPVHIYHNIEGLRPELIIALLNLPTSILPYFHRIGESVDEDGNVVIDERYLQYFYINPDTIEWYQDKDEKGKLVWKPNPEKAEYLPLNSLVILDEVQNTFGSRDFAEAFSKACIKYLTRHRHYGHTIWWASQNVEQVDVTFRRNTQYVWFLESLENYALMGGADSFKISKYEGWLAGIKTGIAPYAVEKVKKDKKFFQCYNSHVSKNVKEVHYKTNMWTSNKGLRIVAVLIIICIVVAIVMGNPLKKSLKGHSSPKATTAPPAALKGFTPQVAEGGGSKSEEITEDCVTQSYIYKGEPFLIINGKSVKPKAGKKYVECDTDNSK